MTTNQVLFGVGLILALAASSQVLASLLKIPAIIILLPAGFVAGAITPDVNPQHLRLLLRTLRLGEVLGTTAQLASVVAVAAACDILRDDAGLISAIVMGLAVANLPGFDIPARRPFFETLVQLIIGVLFVSISATVTPASLRHLVLPSLGLIAVLVLITRPLVALLATARTDMTAGERWFTGWMAPRASSPRPPRRRSPPGSSRCTSRARPRSSRSRSSSSWSPWPSTA